MTLVKSVTNNNGGSALNTAWTLTATGSSNISGVTGNAAVTNAAVLPGGYILGENGGPAGYAAGTWSCVKNAGAPVIGNAPSLAAGDVMTCTINNDDQAATLKVIKHVVGDGSADEFTLHVTGGSPSPASFAGVEGPDGTTVTLNAGEYSVSEDSETFWVGTYSEDCSGTIANGETKTCTVTNTFTPPAPVFACDDDIDNDDDDFTDYPNDPGCSGLEDNDETNVVIPATGSIEIKKYVCSEGTVVTRSANGVGEGDTVPETCSAQEDVTFSYVHGESSNNFDDATGELADAAAGNEDGIGTTNGSGILTFSGLAATGRYLVYESDESGTQLSSSEIINLYCEGDGDTGDVIYDNQELTFVTEGNTARCVAYNVGIPEVCTEDSVTIVSDTLTTFDGEGSNPSELVSFIHEAWTANIPTASWIWSVSTGPYDPTANQTLTFSRDFWVGDTATSAVLDIATDDGYIVRLNGDLIGTSEVGTYSSETQEQYNVLPSIEVGTTNTLTIEVTNTGMEGATPENHFNPAGLLYKLAVTAGTCDGVDEEEGGGGDGGPEPTAWITVVKRTPNSYGVFDVTVDGGSTNETREISTAYAGDYDSETFGIFPAGGEGTSYTISEEVPTGWEFTSLYCEYEEYGEGEEEGVSLTNGSSITVEPGEEVTCTFVNTATTGFVKVIKEVINNDGEHADAEDFDLTVSQNSEVLSAFAGSEDGVVVSVPVGSYAVTEDFNHNYQATYSSDCNGTIAEIGEYKICTVVNDDVTEDDDGSTSGSEANPTGSVLGASTDTSGSVLGALSCSFLSYEQLLTIKNGNGADPEIVKALQEWLNSSQGAGLAVTGVYDQPTRFAVMLLQEKYASDTLSPWGLTKATGNVWQTTARLIIRLVCGVDMPLPSLTPFAL